MKRFASFLLILALGAAVHACAVPVFRYALERWPPDPFQVTILHKGLDESTLDAWLDPVYHANMSAMAVDLREQELPEDAPDPAKALAAEVTDSSPRFLLEYPFDYGFVTPIFSGELTEENKALLLTSPVREEIVKRILGGHSTVWVFIPGTDENANRSLRTILEEGLKEMNETLELPEKMLDIYTPEMRKEVEEQLPIRFSILELDRNDPREKVLIESLKLMLGEEVWAQTDRAWVMPVFGQGRALAIEDQETFTGDILKEMSYFLTGSCSCEVKALNPGFDVFIVEPWMEDLERSFVDEAKRPPQLFNPLAYEPEPETEENVASEAESADVVPDPTPVPQPEVAETEPEAEPESGLNGMVILGGAVALLLGAGLAFARKGGGDA